MQVSNPNNVKIYNLSAGKSLPEWLSDRKKRLLQKKDIDIRRRIQLIQDFEMPGLSNQVKMSKDGHYVLVTGIYKPRIRCYDVNQLSMKFERCFDSEVVKFLSLADDYSKLVFLQADRYVEFHAAYGRYFRLRIPKFGRDLAYHEPSADLFLVGAGSEVYRLNLEQGRFLNSYQTDARSINVSSVNPAHHLLMLGTEEGRVEAWDPRCRERVGLLDCALSLVTQESEIKGIPSITSIAFEDGLTMGVGTTNGFILLYDIRSSKPITIKDHLYGLPILDLAFHRSQNLVLSQDPKIVKIWDKNTGKPFTSIQASSDMNNLCVLPNTGMMFMANEDPKVLVYYIPSLGPAPKWCSFLDSLTEELEETNQDTVYDDYRFITKKELVDLGLSHLIGSSLLRGYMHGYFIDVRLYNKAKSLADPFAYEEYRRKKIREKVEAQRENRVQLKRLPKVNKELAVKIIEKDTEEKAKTKKLPSLMKDDRFKALFENPDFQVDAHSEEYRLLHPLVSKADKAAAKKVQSQNKKPNAFAQFEKVDNNNDNDEDDESEEESSDDDRTWADEIKKQHRLIKNDARIRRDLEDEEAEIKPSFYEIRSGEQFSGLEGVSKRNPLAKASLAERLEKTQDDSSIVRSTGSGEKTFTFKQKKGPKTNHRKQELMEKHLEERKKLRRSAKSISKKRKF